MKQPARAAAVGRSPRRHCEPAVVCSGPGHKGDQSAITRNGDFLAKGGEPLPAIGLSSSHPHNLFGNKLSVPSNAERTMPTVPPQPAESTLRALPEKWRVMVVDDHPLVRGALKAAIDAQPGMITCADAGSPAEAMSLLGRIHPHLIITDFTMPGRDGIEFIKDLRAFDPHAQILVLTMHDEGEYAERVLRAGARGFIMKSLGSEAVIAAIFEVMNGGVYVSPRISARVLRRLASPDGDPGQSATMSLTDREFEVFQRIGEGFDATEIATRLQLSRKTVDVHRANIKRKLEIASTTALIRYAVQWHEARHALSPGSS